MSPLFRSRRTIRPTRRFSTNRLNLQKKPNVRMMLQPLEERAVPAVFTVMDGGDTGGATQLRAIWETARTNGTDDTINFDSAVTSVTLTSALNQYTENNLLTITGNGKGVTTINAAASTRIFDFSVAAGNPTITITDIKLTGGSSAANGGAILDNNEPLVLTNVAFVNNQALNGGAVATAASTTTLTITGCDFTTNTATNAAVGATNGGGAIFLGGAATLTVNTSVFDGGRAVSGSSIFASSSVSLNSDSATFKNGKSTGTSGQSAGAIMLVSGSSTVVIDHSVITGNSSGRDGGFMYCYNSGSNATIKNSTISSNTATGRGGVIRLFSTSTMTLTNNTITFNTAGGIGGAINAGGTLNVSSTTFTGNTSGGVGGAVYGSGLATYTFCSFTSNTAVSNGGAIRNSSTVTLNNSVFTGNTANGSTGGGAVYATSNLNSTLNVFTNNRSNAAGGAIRVGGNSTVSFSSFENNFAGSLGGAINPTGGTLTVSNSTFFKNTASTTGGGISASTSVTINQSTFNKNLAQGTGGGGGIAATTVNPLIIRNSTIADNTASGASTAANGGGIVRTSTSSITLESTIVAGNKVTGTGTQGKDIWSVTAATISAGANSLISDATNANITFPGSFLLNVDPLLNTVLFDYGGFTLPGGSKIKTLPFKAGSPAIDTGSNTFGFTLDQRDAGFPRVSGASIDIGATEGAAAFPIPIATLTSAPNINAPTLSPETIVVHYNDNSGFDTTTFGITDILVTGNGFGAGVNAASFAVSGAGTDYDVTYTINAPSGGWGGVNIGTYSVNIVGSQVADDSTNFVPAGNLGSFKTNFAVTLLVDEASDTSDGNFGVGKLSFREALSLANGNGGTDSINFDSTVFNSASTITIGGAAMPISDSVVITGPAASLTFSGGSANKLFTVTGGNVSISNLGFTAFSGGVLAFTAASQTVTLTNDTFTANTTGGAVSFTNTGDSITISNSKFTGNTNGTSGGAITMTGAGTITVSGTTIQGNTSGGSGGGVNLGTTGSSVTFTNSVIKGNTSSSSGGGINSTSNTIAFSKTLLDTNTSGGSGGGALFLSSANTVTIDQSQVSGNTTSAHGAIYFFVGGSLTVTDSSFINNTAATSGGAIANWTNSCVITNSTFYGNRAPTGAAIACLSSTSSVTLNNCTIVGNTATSSGAGGVDVSSTSTVLYINSSIVSDNYLNATPFDIRGANTTTFAGDNNLIGKQETSWVASGAGNQIGFPSGANVPANNAGITLLDGSFVQTCSLQPASLARDNGNNTIGLTFDQRGTGHPRTIGVGTDVGAFEATANPLPIVSGTTVNVTVAGPSSYDVTVTFKDDIGIDISTIDVNDVVIKSVFGGLTYNATGFVASPGSGVATPVVCTFTFTPPGGTWDAPDTDLYQLWYVGPTVKDADTPTANSVAAPQKLSTFSAALGAVNLKVSNTGDTDDGNYAAGQLTLREAINFANGNVGQLDTISFDTAVTSPFNGPATITLGSGFTVSDSVTINGTGVGNLNINANAKGNHFSVSGIGTTLDISSVTLSGGSVAGKGGSITWGAHTISLTNCVVTGNTASGGGGAFYSSVNDFTTSVINITNSEITNNRATAGNGGVFVTVSAANSAQVNIMSSLISGNSASGDGGSMYFYDDAICNIQNSTFTGNTAGGTGGAIYFYNIGAANVVMANNTFSGNKSGGTGGAFFFGGTAFSPLMDNSIVAGNTGSTAATNDTTTRAFTGDYNVVGIANGSTFSGANNISGVDTAPVNALLDTLKNNGGYTRTMALLVGSPALDIGGSTTLTFDQRGPGFPRVVNGLLDAGAYEAPIPATPQVKLLSAPPVVVQPSETITVVYTDDVGIDTTTLDNNDITVSGPGYVGAMTTSFTGFTGGGASVTATYTVVAPLGGWGGWNIGNYTITMVGGQVSDTVPLSVVGKNIGTFNTTIASSLQVDEASDVDDGDYSVGKRSLREAVKLTSQNIADDSITFLGASFTGTPIVVGSTMNITDNVQITGPGVSKLILDGNNSKQIFVINVPGTGTVGLSNMTLQKGSSTIGGGAIGTVDDSITLSTMTFTNNSVTGAGGAVGASGAATINVHGSQFKTNTASQNGGAIFLASGQLNVDPSMFVGNRGLNGGAIAAGGTASITLVQTLVDNNVATGTNSGGVQLLGTGTLTITDSTISRNTSTSQGGGIGIGAGVAVAIKNSTIANNKGTVGGGIAQFGATTLTLDNTTVSGNIGTTGVGGVYFSVYTASFTTNNSIIAANTGGGTNPDIAFVGAGTGTVAGNYNLIGKQDATWAASGTGNLIGGVTPLDPGLSPLADNGGFVLPDGTKILTMSLKGSSPAIDAGDPSFSPPPNFDERGTGFNRKNGTAIDMGAFETSSTPTPFIGGVAANNVTSPGGTTFDVTITYKDDIGINTGTIDVSDITVNNVIGSKVTLNPISVSFSGGPNVVTAVYTFNAPNNTVAGTWDASDTNFYAINFVGIVQDTDGNKVATPQNNIGSFAATLGGMNLVVDNTASGDVDDGNYTSGNLTLREAVNLANANTGNLDTISFSLPANTTITLTSGLTVSDSVSISGSGKNNLTVNANNTGRIINVTGVGTTLDVASITLSGGSVTGKGGAIQWGAHTVSLVNTLVTGNTASGGGGAFYSTLNDPALSVINITDSEISNNRATAGNGGVFVTVSGTNSAQVNITSSLITGNSSSGDGGALYFFDDAVANIVNSTFSGNTAGGVGGAIYFYNTGLANVTMTSDTFTKNTAASTGGALFFGGTAFSPTIDNSIVAGNKGSTTASNDISKAVSFNGDYNVIGISNGSTFSGGFNQVGDATTPLDAMLGSLSNNGGLTRTHALKSGSPALDIGGSTTLTFDQRGAGFPRVLNGLLDAGAHEGIAVIPEAKLISAPNVNAPGAATYSFDIAYTDDNAMDLASIGNLDVTVKGPGYAPAGVNAISTSTVGSGNAITVTYTIQAPAGAPADVFDIGDNGTYTISINGSQVFDLDTPTPNSVLPISNLGTFNVGIGGIYTVDTPLDVVNPIDGLTSLREALTATNNSIGAQDTIRFSGAVFGSSTNTITMSLGEFVVSDSVIINDNGVVNAKSLTINAGGASRLFNMTSGKAAQLTISGMKLMGGSNTSLASGILVGTTDSLTLDGVWLTGNSGTAPAGGINVDTALSPSTSAITIRNSTISGNSGATAGAIYFLRGTAINISNSTLSGNSGSTAGAIAGFTTSSGSINIRNSTITGNSGSTGKSFRFTPAAYSVGILSLESTIVSGNVGSGTSSIYGPTYAGWFNQKTSVVDSHTGTANDLGGNLADGTDPLLGVLQDNGGPVPTHAISNSSPAKDAGSNPDTLSFDERGTGFSRTQFGGTDMGAFEIQPAAKISAVTLDDGVGTNINGVNATVQRSNVRRMIVTFNQPVTFSGSVTAAFTLSRNAANSNTLFGSGSGNVGLVSVSPGVGVTSVTITFAAGPLVDTTGSIVDGRYDLTIDASQISNINGNLDGDGDNNAGGNYQNLSNPFPAAVGAGKIYRFFGDANGNGTVDQAFDFVEFKNAFGFNNSFFQFNHSAGVVNQATDFVAFKNHFGLLP